MHLYSNIFTYIILGCSELPNLLFGRDQLGQQTYTRYSSTQSILYYHSTFNQSIKQINELKLLMSWLIDCFRCRVLKCKVEDSDQFRWGGFLSCSTTGAVQCSEVQCFISRCYVIFVIECTLYTIHCTFL